MASIQDCYTYISWYKTMRNYMNQICTQFSNFQNFDSKVLTKLDQEYNINGANSEVYARMKQLSKEVRETSNYLKNYVIPEISDAIDYEYDRIRRKEAELAAGSSN